jgi:serine/threonine protein kinase
MIGKQILNYQVKSLIGEGGMGNVYLAEHTSIGRTVAIKALRSELASNEEIRKRFKNEASVMARLQHPSIVSLFDYVEQDGGLYLIMEYVEGQELTDLLRDLKHPLPIARAKNIMTGILKAFAYAHSNGVVHRDVKPANILITKDDKVKVLDFGIAKLVGDSEFNLTKTGTQVGTVYYMSPEQVKAKELDLRSDIYSLGITFYELFTGFCPYKTLTSEYEVYDKIVKQDLIPLTETMGDDYEQVWEVIKKATAKNPDNRYQTCENLLSDLNVKHNATPKKKPREKETIISDSSISSNINSEKTQTVAQAMNNSKTLETIERERGLPYSSGALVCGILGVLTCFWGIFGIIGLLLSILAVVLGASATTIYKRSSIEYTDSSYRVANAGNVLGIIGMSVFVLMELAMY